MSKKTTGLGRGLEAIFQIEKAAISPDSPLAEGLKQIEVGAIDPNPDQPRRDFDPEALEELATSIRELGIIQPITVREEPGGRYLIISGERRWRASRLAGLKTVPAYVRRADGHALHEMALVENIQREDLNPMEIALSLQRLIDECDFTQESLAARVGKKRSTVANYLRLLTLPAPVQAALRQGLITMGHAKAIAAAPEKRRLALLERCIDRGLSVRQTEELSAAMLEHGRKPRREDRELPASYLQLIERLESVFSQNITIKASGKGGGKIVIDFADDAEIDRFLDRLGRTLN